VSKSRNLNGGQEGAEGSGSSATPGFYGSTITVNVLVNGNLIQTAVNSGGGKTLRWEQFNTTFVANSTSSQIEFLNGDPRTDNSNGLDNSM